MRVAEKVREGRAQGAAGVSPDELRNEIRRALEHCLAAFPRGRTVPRQSVMGLVMMLEGVLEAHEAQR